MSLSDKEIQEFKDIYKKKYGIDLSDKKARDCGERLIAFANILIDQAIIKERRKRRLKKEPNGFCLEETEGAYSCRVCYQSVSGKNAWWDKWGVKCLNCQRNLKEGVIPPEICKNNDLAVCNWQLKSDFGLHSSIVRKLRREKKLIGRDLKRKDETIYHTIYLISENKDFLNDILKRHR